MTPKEKANQLVVKFRDDPFTSQITMAGAKQCSLICVDEILSLKAESWDDSEKNPHHYYSRPYWQQVKTEIQSL